MGKLQDKLALFRRAYAMERKQATCSHLFAHFDREVGPGVMLRSRACGLCGKREGEEWAVIMPELWDTIRALAIALPSVRLETLRDLVDELEAQAKADQLAVERTRPEL